MSMFFCFSARKVRTIPTRTFCGAADVRGYKTLEGAVHLSKYRQDSEPSIGAVNVDQ
jgi:hypothetical protein